MKQGLNATAGTLALIAALALSGHAQAQNANDQAAAGSTAAPADQSTAQNSAADAGALQEVVVTAERRAVNIQQTPVVVTAIEGDQIESLHVTTIESLSAMVPGYQTISQQGQFVDNNIRGLGTVENTPVLQLGTKVILDGVVQDIVSGQDKALYDMRDVEVLEGPQGTFVGASAIGGAVEQNTADPNFNGFNGYVLGGGGSYDDVHLQGAVNLPVSDTFAIRLAFNFEQEHSFWNNIGSSLDGFYYQSYSATNPASDGAPKGLLQGTIGSASELNDPGSVDAHSLRVKMLWKPADNVQDLFEFIYNTNDTGGTTPEPSPYTYQNLFAYSATACTTQPVGTNYPQASGTQLLCPGAGVVTHSTFYYPGEQPYVLDYYGTAEEFNDEYFQLGNELRYTLDDGIVVRSQTGFIHINQQQQSNNSSGPEDDGYNYHSNGPNWIPSEEVDLISPTTGKVSWIAGTYWELRYSPVPDSSETCPPPYQPGCQPTVYSESAIGAIQDRVYAVFGQVNWQFTDTLQLQVGARENWDDDTSSNPYQYELSPPGTLLPEPNGTGTYTILYTAAACGTITPPCYKVNSSAGPTGEYKDTVPTGKVNLSWTPLPGQNFYLFYARGYSAGGINGGSTDHPTFNPEYVNDWEAGWKGRLLDGHMLTQVGVYYEDLQGYQYPIEDTEALGDTGTGSYIANFAPSTIEGVSFAEQARFGGLGVDLSFDYNKATLGSVSTVNNGFFPAGFGSITGFGSGLNLPQCVAGHTYPSPQECFDYTPYQTNVGGEQMPWAPKYQGFGAVDYLFHVGAGTLDPRVTYAYTGVQYGSIFEDAYTEMGPRHVWGASIDWVVGKWDTQLYGTNVTNETFVYDNSVGSVIYGPLRQVGAQATYKF